MQIMIRRPNHLHKNIPHCTTFALMLNSGKKTCLYQLAEKLKMRLTTKNLYELTT